MDNKINNIVNILDSNRIRYDRALKSLADKGCLNAKCQELCEDIITDVEALAKNGVAGGFFNGLDRDISDLIELAVKLSKRTFAANLDGFKTQRAAILKRAQEKINVKGGEMNVKELAGEYVTKILQAIPVVKKTNIADAVKDNLTKCSTQLNKIQKSLDSVVNFETKQAVDYAYQLISDLHIIIEQLAVSTCDAEALRRVESALRTVEQWRTNVAAPKNKKDIVDDKYITANFLEKAFDKTGDTNMLGSVGSINDIIDSSTINDKIGLFREQISIYEETTQKYEQDKLKLEEEKASKTAIRDGAAEKQEEIYRKYQSGIISEDTCNDMLDDLESELDGIADEIEDINFEMDNVRTMIKSRSAIARNFRPLLTALDMYKESPSELAVIVKISGVDFVELKGLLSLGSITPDRIQAATESMQSAITHYKGQMKYQEGLRADLKEARKGYEVEGITTSRNRQTTEKTDRKETIEERMARMRGTSGRPAVKTEEITETTQKRSNINALLNEDK